MKKSIKILMVSVLILIVLISGFLYFKPFQQEILPADATKLMSTTNLISDGNMERFCVWDAIKQNSFTDDSIKTQCAVMWSKNYDHTPTTALAQSHPYNWDKMYGSGIYKYSGTETAYVGSKMAILDKSTHDDWYGFGYEKIPVTAGKLYEAFFYVKRISKSGDDRDCGVSVGFKNSAGQSLTVLDSTTKVTDDLSKGANGWNKVYVRALAPDGATTGGFQIWCAQNGNYQYLIDGQYFGETTICTVGQTKTCGEYSTGACKKGTQTCTVNGLWGTCSGNINPISEICNNNIDDNCNGIADSAEPLCEGITPPAPKINYTIYVMAGILIMVVIVGGYLILKNR